MPFYDLAMFIKWLFAHQKNYAIKIAVFNILFTSNPTQHVKDHKYPALA